MLPPTSHVSPRSRRVAPTRRRLAAAAVALAMFTAACGSTGVAGLGPQVAATVDGVAITVDQLAASVAANAQNSAGSPEDAQRTVLGQLIFETAFFSIVTERGITVEAQAIEDEIDFNATSAGLEREAWLLEVETNLGFDEARVRELIERQLLDTALRDELFASIEIDEQTIRDTYEARRAQFETATVRHILVDTEEEAIEIIALIQAGGDFAELAMERSTGPSGPDGGNLGTGPADQYVVEFADAVRAGPVGEVIDVPIQTQFGFHVIEVLERQSTSYEAAQDGIRDELAGQELEPLYEATLLPALLALDVVINSRFGQWDPSQGLYGGVVPAGVLAPKPAERGEPLQPGDTGTGG